MKSWMIISMLLIVTSCGMHRQSALGRHLFVAQKTGKIVDTNSVTRKDSNSYYTSAMVSEPSRTHAKSTLKRKSGLSLTNPSHQSTIKRTHKSDFISVVAALSPFPRPQEKKEKEIRIHVSQEKSLRWANKMPSSALAFSILSILAYLTGTSFLFLVLVGSIVGGLFIPFLLVATFIFEVIGIVLSAISLKHIKYHSHKSSKEAVEFWTTRRKRALTAFMISIIPILIVLILIVLMAVGIAEFI